MTSPSPTSPASRTTPLWAVLLFTFLNSIGSAIVYSGIFFIAKSAYGFKPVHLFLLGLLYGVMYIPAAYFVGPIQRALRSRGITPRSMLAGQMVLMAAACVLPWLMNRLAPASSEWAIWVAIALYSPLSGAMWPVVESYMAGGRTEAQLRAAIGKFNVCWSGSIVVTMLAISPLIKNHALTTLPILAAIHLACITVLAAFQSQPGAHEHHEHHASITSKRLLEFLRFMLPTAFMFIAALSPYLPTAFSRLGVKPEHQTALAAIWLAARVATFFALERWHGWHGRWTTPIAGCFILLASFATILVGPLLLSGTPGLASLAVGLAGFGVGVGIIYAAALYYAMEVGSAGVDAGGTHEALIGIGYATGPLCGLAAAGLAAGGVVSTDSKDLWLLGLVSVVGLGIGIYALIRSSRHFPNRMAEGGPVRV